MQVTFAQSLSLDTRIDTTNVDVLDSFRSAVASSLNLQTSNIISLSFSAVSRRRLSTEDDGNAEEEDYEYLPFETNGGSNQENLQPSISFFASFSQAVNYLYGLFPASLIGTPSTSHTSSRFLTAVLRNYRLLYTVSVMSSSITSTSLNTLWTQKISNGAFSTALSSAATTYNATLTFADSSSSLANSVVLDTSASGTSVVDQSPTFSPTRKVRSITEHPLFCVLL